MGWVGAWVGVAVGTLTLLAAFARYVVRPAVRTCRRVVKFARDLRDALEELRELVTSFSRFVAEIEARLARIERHLGLPYERRDHA